jgi:folate receptor
MRRDVLLALVLVAAPSAAWDSCRPFKDIYANGKELCEKMWGDSFAYETDESKAYTMWFFDAMNNPNNAIATALGKDPTPDQCTLQYFHKSGGGQEPGGYHTGVYAAPSPEGDDFTECHPWKESSCCHNEVVTTPKAINEAYGEGYHWDRCDGWVEGYTMSSACQRFFVQEACMYECDPHSGAYRRYTDAQADAYTAFQAIDGNPGDYAGLPADDPLYAGTFEHDGVTYNKIIFRGNGVYGPNKWQMYQMPIKASYCDAFLTACASDYFCGEGDFWACSADWKANATARAAQAEAEALSAALLPFPEDIRAQVRGMNVTSATAASVAQDLVDAREEANRKIDGAKNEMPPWAVVLVVALVVIFLLVTLFATYVIRKEKQGKPIFLSLDEVKSKPTTASRTGAELASA